MLKPNCYQYICRRKHELKVEDGEDDSQLCANDEFEACGETSG